MFAIPFQTNIRIFTDGTYWLYFLPQLACLFIWFVHFILLSTQYDVLKNRKWIIILWLYNIMSSLILFFLFLAPEHEQWDSYFANKIFYIDNKNLRLCISLFCLLCVVKVIFIKSNSCRMQMWTKNLSTELSYFQHFFIIY